jgi:hypothetical protein
MDLLLSHPDGSSRRLLHLLLLIFILAVAIVTTAPAQYREWRDTTSAPIRIPYNIGATEFWIGTIRYFEPEDRPIANTWAAYDSLGISTLYLAPYIGWQPNPYARWDSLMNAIPPGKNYRTLPIWIPYVDEASRGREIKFFPFNDSGTSSPAYQGKMLGEMPCVFAIHSGGSRLTNTVEFDEITKSQAAEQLYTSVNTSPNQLVASDIAFKWNSTQTNRYMQNSDLMLTGRRDNSTTYNVVLAGHMRFSDGLAADTAVIFNIKVYYDINEGGWYLDDTLGTVFTGSNDIHILVDTFQITKGELLQGIPGVGVDAYRVISRALPLWWRRYDGGPGPLHPGQPSTGPVLKMRHYDPSRFAIRSVNLFLERRLQVYATGIRSWTMSDGL